MLKTKFIRVKERGKHIPLFKIKLKRVNTLSMWSHVEFFQVYEGYPFVNIVQDINMLETKYIRVIWREEVSTYLYLRFDRREWMNLVCEVL